MKKLILLGVTTACLFLHSCKKEDSSNTDTTKPMGNTFISFTMDGRWYETQGEVPVGENVDLHRWFVLRAPNRFDPNSDIGFGMRNTKIDSVSLPYTFKAIIGGSKPNVEIFYLTKENGHDIIYTITSAGFRNTIVLSEVDTVNKLIKGHFDGVGAKYKQEISDDSVKVTFISDVTISDGKYVLSYKK